MAFRLPELPALVLATTKKGVKEEDTKKYRLSLSNINNTSNSLPDLRQYTQLTSRVEHTENSIISFSTQKNENNKQPSKKSKHAQLKPLVTKCEHGRISKNGLIWVEPFGLWASRKKARRLYEKFSNRIDLQNKGPDYLVDPCPHIPRCKHSGSWSPVKLERQKFRELRELRDQQLYQRTLERYRHMQDLWLQQLNSKTNILQTTSSQARLDNFRKFAGAPLNPLSEMERLERLKARHKEWEDAWKYENEQRLKNSQKNGTCSHPRIIVTDYDTDDDVVDNIDLTLSISDEILDIMLKQVEVSRAGHADTAGHAEYAERYGETYDIVCTPVDCCSQLDNLTRVHCDRGNVMSRKVNYIDETKNELKREESFPETRTTPRVYKPYERAKPQRKEPINRDKLTYIEEKGKEFPNSEKCQIQDPWSLSSISSADAGLGSSIEDLTELSKSNLDLGMKLLNTPLREADNTVNLMSHLIPVPLGMTSRRIPDQNITSSSTLDIYHVGNQARLHNEKQGCNGGSWIPRANDTDPYLEVDIGNTFTVQQVATQGNPASAVKHERHKRWVTKFTLAFSKDGKEWQDYEESGSVKIFIGNVDCDTVVLNSLESPVETRFIRFKPKKWHGGIAMRVEVFGPRPIRDTNGHEEGEATVDTTLDSGAETESKSQQEEQTFSITDDNYEEKDFGIIEDRIVSPVVIHSPIPLLLSPDILDVEQKELQQSKFCVNHLPVCRERESTPVLSNNKDQTEAKVDEEILKTDQDFSMDQGKNLKDKAMSALEEKKRRELQRARADKSIQEQIMREKIAEERRRKLAIMNFQKRESTQAVLEIMEQNYDIGTFLEKYCIIRKPDESIFQRVFEKFDEDGDGYLWPEECLGALENVNTSLLTDSNLNYVFRILELCDCHAESGTSLRLFSVIAALSQKLVALNDKMKLLISQCDFKTIDYTLLRVKMLFECYVNKHTKTISRKDLWVGLAAGGLCHLDEANEAMEDYFGEKQSFDFLDFLTYLPLFQVIHANIVDNPLAAF